MSALNNSYGPRCNTDWVMLATVHCLNHCMTCMYYIPNHIVDNFTGLTLMS